MLTPLQEVASRILAAKIIAYTNDEFLRTMNIGFRIDNAVSEAKLLLQACKPEPLDFKSNEVNPYELRLTNEKNLSQEEVVRLQNLSDAFFEGAKAYQQFINQ
jgi:hypothetical protein